MDTQLDADIYIETDSTIQVFIKKEVFYSKLSYSTEL